ncbi:Putative RNA-directed DNA polymerase from transposon BS-like Protein [Caligus rogercresseyi]|uniref:RNA-directed DNA polymerase from transposon BS-like Protein n=1 Tax=Caligus rogercresseyi TaxID=217165 RepID=A0A7T8GPW7_CALRO|nr:Putative RNA-directed DNA polymerase from transposon BS-like Protein [Caligus rogercresseyi]
MAQDNGSKVAIAAFDYSAAFDTISPSALLDKLHRPAEKVCKTASNLAGLGVFLYADDTSVTVEATTWDDVKAATRALKEDMVEYSRDNALHLNVEKTQILHLKNPQTIGTLGLLGVERSIENGAFGTHHANVLNELRRRTGAIRRLASVLPRGKLLNEIARALVIGKLNVCA